MDSTFLRIINYQNAIRSLSDVQLISLFSSLDLNVKRHVFSSYLSQFKNPIKYDLSNDAYYNINKKSKSNLNTNIKQKTSIIDEQN